jgi:O-antigen/teichoic acid export membrane protein
MRTLASASLLPEARPLVGRRLLRSALGAHLGIPLYRQGYALVLNSGLASLFGIVYWLLAARHYAPHVLGLNSAAISAMMFLAGLSQLNLMSALMRFIPVSGRQSTRFVLSSYLLSVTIAAVVALVFLLGLDVWAPTLRFLSSNPALVLWFIAATMTWCVFNLQDSVLIGVSAAMFVPLENVVYSVVKIALLVALVDASPHYGIFASWTAALVVSLLPVNLLIFRQLLPRHVRAGDDRLSSPTRHQIARFVSADYLGSLFWLGATMLMPVIVVALDGGTANAYFSLAWMIAAPLYAVSANTGASLVVTASRDEGGLPAYGRQVLTQTAGIVIPLAIVLAVAAPHVLSLFGAKYAAHSGATLSLLALSAIPNVVNALYVSVYRVRRRMSAVLMLLGCLCGLALGLGVTLLQLLGIPGVGLAWLIAQSLVAAVLLLIEPGALWPSRRSGSSIAGVPIVCHPAGLARNLAANLGVLGVLVRLRRGPAARRRAQEARRMTPEILASIPPGLEADPPTRWAQHRSLPTVTDISVIMAGPPGQSPRAVIKLATTTPAAQSLRRECDALAALHADARLRDWFGVLPTVLTEGELAGRPYVVQRMLPGVVASRMVASEDGARQILTAAASAIGELHRRTARLTAVDSAALERWVDGPARFVLGVGGTRAGGASGLVAIDRLAEELRETLQGRTLPQSWVHGDFTPSNILVSADGAAVVGIVDWELADSADLPSLDVVGLLLSTRAHRRRRQLGDVVRELVTGAPWTEFEQALIDSACSGCPCGRVDSRTLVLLWWLRHVAGNLTKSTRYTPDGLWARWNIRVVLDALERP